MASNVQVSLTPEKVALAPGDTAEFAMVIRNVSDVPEQYSIEVQGIPASWSRLSTSNVSLPPGAKESVLINVNPPAATTSEGAPYNVSVKIASKRDTTMFTSVSFRLDLRASSEWDLDLLPKQAKGHKKPFRVLLINKGDIPNTFKLAATDPEDIYAYRFSSDTMAVDPGATSEVTLTITPKKKPSPGESGLVRVSVSATPANGEAKTVTGLIERRAGSGCALGLVAMLGAALWLWYVS